MTDPDVVTVPPSLLRMLTMLVVGNFAIVAGIVVLFGLGWITVWACAVVASLTTSLYVVAAVLRRPRVDITPDGFAFEKLIGREAHRWEDIDGPFAVIRIGIGKAVAYNLTPECKARTGTRPTTMFSGYDAAVVGGSLPCSADELADLLNEHIRRHRGSADTAIRE